MHFFKIYFLSFFLKNIQKHKKIGLKLSIVLSLILLFFSRTSFAADKAHTEIVLSPYSLFLNADIVVKIVIIILVLTSIVSWIIWVAKLIEIKKKNKLILESIYSIQSLEKIDQDLKLSDDAANLIYQAAKQEFNSAQNKNSPILQQLIKERVAGSIERIIASDKHHLSLGTSFLATTGAVAPFVGLFGTVWGIMHSFVSIAQSNTTSLSVVAPGIAEALFATALGLFAAIPAVVLYNATIRAIIRHTLLVEDSATGILNLLSRQLESFHEVNISASQHTLGVGQ